MHHSCPEHTHRHTFKYTTPPPCTKTQQGPAKQSDGKVQLPDWAALLGWIGQILLLCGHPPTSQEGHYGKTGPCWSNDAAVPCLLFPPFSSDYQLALQRRECNHRRPPLKLMPSNAKSENWGRTFRLRIEEMALRCAPVPNKRRKFVNFKITFQVWRSTR